MTGRRVHGPWQMMWVVAIGLAGCVEPPPEALDDCRAMCDVTVVDCALPTWPSRDSCVDGCLGNAEAGADIESQKLCVELSECDLFALVECEHAYGPR